MHLIAKSSAAQNPIILSQEKTFAIDRLVLVTPIESGPLLSVLGNDCLDRLGDDIGHVIKVLVVPHEGHAAIAGPGEHLTGHGERIVGGGKAPVDEISGIGLVTEELDGKAVGATLVEELLGHLLGKVLAEVELDGIMDGLGNTGSVDGDAHVLTDALLELGSKGVVTPVVLLNSLVEGKELGLDDGGGKGAHAETVVGELVGEITEVLRARDSNVLGGKALVGASVNSAASSDVRIVGEKEPTLTGVYHLVRLTANTANLSHVAGVLALPFDAERVSAILKEGGTVPFAGLQDSIHITDLTAHVRNENVLAIGVSLELLLQIRDIHNVVVIRLDIDGLHIHTFVHSYMRRILWWQMRMSTVVWKPMRKQL
jgi:hypothetical protein